MSLRPGLKPARLQPVQSARRICVVCVAKALAVLLHVVAECDEYGVLRRSHSGLFAALGGWASFPGELTADQLHEFMHQPASQVSEFLFQCGQRGWQDPPLDVLFADGLSAEEAGALIPGVEGLCPGSSDQFFSVLSDDFYSLL